MASMNDYYTLADALGMKLKFEGGLVYAKATLRVPLGGGQEMRLKPDSVSSVLTNAGNLGLLFQVSGKLGLYVMYDVPTRDVLLYVVDLSGLPDDGASLFENAKCNGPVAARNLLIKSIRAAFLGANAKSAQWKPAPLPVEVVA